VMHGWIGYRPFPAQLLLDPAARLPEGAGFAFPSAHTAAMAVVATPYLTVRYRNLASAVAVLVGAADVYLGGHLPLDAFAAIFLGWAVGTIFHLVLGAPGRRTSAEGRASGTGSGRAGADRRGAAPTPSTGAVGVRGTDVDRGPATGADRAPAAPQCGPWYRLQRLLASLDVEDEPPLSSTYHEAEHEAFVTLFAQRAGLRTPPVITVCETGHGSPLLVRRHIEGRRLTHLDPPEIDDPLLDSICAQLAILGDARIAHHDLRARNIPRPTPQDSDADRRPVPVDRSARDAGRRDRPADTDLPFSGAPETIVGLLLFGAAVYVLLPQLSGLREVVESLRGANRGWLVVSVWRS
jgi:glycosyltransferase 2 family protein